MPPTVVLRQRGRLNAALATTILLIGDSGWIITPSNRTKMYHRSPIGSSSEHTNTLPNAKPMDVGVKWSGPGLQFHLPEKQMNPIAARLLTGYGYPGSCPALL